MPSSHFLARALTLSAVLVGLWAVPGAAATFTVNRTHDAVDARPGDGVCETAPGNRICTLRAAIQEANARLGADTVNIPAGTYTLTLQSGSHEEAALNGDLDITDSLTVVGAGASRTTITASAPPPVEIERIFEVHGPISVTFRRLTILNGGRRAGVGFGAGIANHTGTVAVQDSELRGGSASEGVGGGIANQTGTVTISNSRINGNGAEAGGGGGIANLGGTVIVTNSTISGNVTQDGTGAGILNDNGTVMIVNSTVADNRTGGQGQGGAITNIRGLIIATNTTFKGNSSGIGSGGDASGGGIVNVGGTVTLSNVTIAENVTPPVDGSVGGGLLNIGAGRITIHNSLLARNEAPTGADCSGTITSLGHNIVGNLNGCTFVRGPSDNVGDPRLGDFVAGTSPGRGHFPLEPGSPAIDRGLSPTCGAVDQLNQPRQDGNAMGGTQCDRGAVEFQP